MEPMSLHMNINPSSSLQKRSFLRPPMIVSVSITVVPLSLDCHQQYCRFLPSPLVKPEMFSVKCYLSLCSPLVPRNLTHSSMNYILYFFCSLPRIYLILLGFTHQFLLSLTFKAELLSHPSRQCFCLIHDPKY